MAPRIAFHIGYHKTATTWFQREALPRHPKVGRFLDGGVAENPFLRSLIMTPDRSFDPREARALFDARVRELDVPDDGVVIVSEERLSGHAATGGFDTFRVAERIAAVCPEALVFFVVREQTEMIESEYLQLVQEGGLASLDDLIHFTPRLATVPGFDLGHYEYDLLADHYAELLGPERLKLFEFRSVVADPARFLDDISEFLAIEHWPPLPPEILGKRVNPTLPRRLLGVRRFLNHFERRPLNPHPLISLPPFWRAPLWWLAARLPARRRPLLDPETRAALEARYERSNERLAQGYNIHW